MPNPSIPRAFLLLAGPSGAGLIIGAAALFALGFALLSQYGFGHAPCELCHWQRWPYIAALPLAGLAAFGPAMLRAPAALFGLAALLGTAGIGAFHAGVEQGWWAGPSGCSAAAASAARTVEELRAALMTTAVVRCDEVSWSFLGLSMAVWNSVFAIGAAGLATWLMRRPVAPSFPAKHTA